MTLFARAEDGGTGLFAAVLEAYFAGLPDQATADLLGRGAGGGQSLAPGVTR